MTSLFAVSIFLLLAAFYIYWNRRSFATCPRILGDVLLVFAHPDDEAMFFSPFLEHLKRRGIKVHFLCLSNGNSSGLGAARKQELYRSAEYFGVVQKNVRIVDHPALQDGMNTTWDTKVICQAVLFQLQKADSVRMVVTFDHQGVSAHPNHIAVYNGVCAAKENAPSGVKFLCLRSRGLLEKYTGVLAVMNPLTLADLSEEKHRLFFLVPPLSCFTSFFAMRMHRTQMVWFRYLFVIFSSYTYSNDLEEL